MAANGKDEGQTHGQVEKLVQIGKVAGGVTIQDTSESYARCPICKRNDEVKKVSAIVIAETHNMDGVTIEKRSYTDKDGKTYDSTERVPFSGRRASSLAQYISPPEKPRIGGTKYDGIVTVCKITAGLGFLAAILGGIQCLWGPAILGAILASLFWLAERYNNSLRDIELKEQSIKIAPEITKWDKAIKRWDALYYCGRDDCVFVPGENTSASSSKMMDYIYRE